MRMAIQIVPLIPVLKTSLGAAISMRSASPFPITGTLSLLLPPRMRDWIFMGRNRCPIPCSKDAPCAMRSNATSGFGKREAGSAASKISIMRCASSRMVTSFSGVPMLKICRSQTPPGLSRMRMMQSTASSIYV